MIYLTHIPPYPLSLFIEWLWFFDQYTPQHTLERVLPQGCVEIIIDLQSHPKRLFDRDDYRRFQHYRRCWIAGAHACYHVIEATLNSSMMGVHFKPGGAHPFLGFPLTELTGQVVELDQIWGSAAIGLRDQLLETPHSAGKFKVLQDFLMQRLHRSCEAPPVVACALQEFEVVPHARTIQTVAEHLGISHKHFIREFSKWVGLTPKTYCRIRRFQGLLHRVEKHADIEWADLACACGYYDQAHFIRDFQAFSGLNPSAYLTHRGEYLNYVPIDTR